MEQCCDNKNVIFTDYYVCINCGAIHEYKYTLELTCYENENNLNKKFISESFYKRINYLNKKLYWITDRKNPFPLICLIELNFDFNLSQIIRLPIKYGLLFLVIFPLTFLLLVFFYKIDNIFPLYIIIHINSFFKKSLELNNVKNLIKSFLLLIS